MATIYLCQHGDADPDDDVVVAADVESQLLGHEPRWRRVVVTSSGPRGDRGSIVMVGEKMALPEFPADIPQPAWADVAHPPTGDDPAVLVLHVIRFEDAADAATTPDQMREYTDHAARVAGPAGGRIAAWFAISDTPRGDGRTWHQARFNAFPSKAAFMAVALDPKRLEAQRTYREAAIADTYTMILRPTIGRPTDDRLPFEDS